MIKLCLSKSIYDVENIKTARKAFSGIASISFIENEKYYVCSFSECTADETLTMKEFENHIIDLSNIHNGHN